MLGSHVFPACCPIVSLCSFKICRQSRGACQYNHNRNHSNDFSYVAPMTNDCGLHSADRCWEKTKVVAWPLTLRPCPASRSKEPQLPRARHRARYFSVSATTHTLDAKRLAGPLLDAARNRYSTESSHPNTAPLSSVVQGEILEVFSLVHI